MNNIPLENGLTDPFELTMQSKFFSYVVNISLNPSDRLKKARGVFEFYYNKIQLDFWGQSVRLNEKASNIRL